MASQDEPESARVPRRTAQGEASRERLLEAAIELIAHRGYAATSVDAICRSAGSVKTALYWHFGSKEGLLAAVVDRVANDWISQLEDAAAHAGQGVGRLDAMLDGLRGIVEGRQHLLRLLFSVLLERMDTHAETREVIRKAFYRAETAIVESLRADYQDSLRKPRMVAQLILSSTIGLWLHQLMDPEATDLERGFQQMRSTTILVVHAHLKELDLVPALLASDET